MHQRADDGHHHAELGHVHSALGGFGMAQALQSENEKDRSKQVTKFDEVCLPVHYDLSADYADFTDSKKELATKKHKRLKMKIPGSGSISIENLRSVLISFCAFCAFLWPMFLICVICESVDYFFVSLRLNILNMRSVIT